MAMGGQCTPITVDGVQGWFTRLEPEELLLPEDLDERFAQMTEWRYDSAVYFSITAERKLNDYYADLPWGASPFNGNGRVCTTSSSPRT